MSTKDRLERKKYMGVWRWESELTAKMMSRFPNPVIRYIKRKSPNMRGCSSGFVDNPWRRNSESCVSFPGTMLWCWWLGMKKKKSVNHFYPNGHYSFENATITSISISTYLSTYLYSSIFFFIFFFIYSEFCHTLKWNSHGFTCVPHPDPPSIFSSVFLTNPHI